jgi:hypothetical protein
MATQIVGRMRWSAERRFYFGMALAMFAVVYLGFARSFFLRPLFPGYPSPSEPIFYVHGAVFTTWLLVLMTQPLLVTASRIDLHRALGRFGAVIAAAVVVLGVAGAIVAARRPGGFINVPVPPLQFLTIPLFAMVLFGSFVALAIVKRRDAQAHKRLMLLATVNLLSAGFARWPFDFAKGGPPVYFALSDLFILALVAWDFSSRGRLHPVTLWAGLATIVAQPLSLMVSGTEPWLAFARWLVGVPG